MTLYTRLLVYPEGDRQEIGHSLSFGAVVDLNGNPMVFPLPSSRMIAYRVSSIRTREKTGESITEYGLERLTEPELAEYT
ncbi:MAG: hypothetical protein JW760_14145 [Spirochaetales bacterium]|nr:hypothetical protein [Spirochaetales bacterium]